MTPLQVHPFKPDTDSYHRLLASLGVLLVALSLAGPLLVFKETESLTVTASELRELTPTARDVINSRQRDLSIVQDATPIGAALVFVVGMGLLLAGARGMKVIQRVEFRTAVAHATAAEAQIESQSLTERDERLREEARTSATADEATESAPRTDSALTAEAHDHPAAATTDALARSMERYRMAEAAVLLALAQRRSGNYSFRPQVAVRDSGRRLLLDGLFSSSDPSRPDVIVEVKYLRQRGYGLRNGADQLLALMARYESATGRCARGWLVAVVDEPAYRETPLDRFEDLLGDRGAVTVLPMEQVPSLASWPLPWD